MYLQESYNVKDISRINQIIENNNFSDLITFNNGALCSNKVPLLYAPDQNALFGHFGRNNTQLIDIKESSEVLVIFTGAHAYISPQWYVSKNRVPTWNFQTVQIRGTAEIVDADTLKLILGRLTAFHEARFPVQWSMSQLDSEQLERVLKAIVGFRIDIKEVKFKEKMSQNRSVEDQRCVVEALVEQGDHAAKDVATLMSKNLKI